MKIIKRGKVNRTEYLLLDRPYLNEAYAVVKCGHDCKVTELYRSTSVISASAYFDNLFKAA